MVQWLGRRGSNPSDPSSSLGARWSVPDSVDGICAAIHEFDAIEPWMQDRGPEATPDQRPQSGATTGKYHQGGCVSNCVQVRRGQGVVV